MAWTEVRCSVCGTEYKVQMTGKMSDREYRAAHWDGLCDACGAKRQADALAVADRDGATLTGSPKQIAWAVQIREQTMTALADAREGIIAKSPVDADVAAKVYDECVEWLRGQGSAAWWIDRRSGGVSVTGWLTLAYGAMQANK